MRVRRVREIDAELGGQMSYAFPTKVTNALGHEAYTQYDYYLGRPVDSEDLNGVLTNFFYDDPLDRLTRVIRAANVASAKNQTTFAYYNTLSARNRSVISTASMIMLSGSRHTLMA